MEDLIKNIRSLNYSQKESEVNVQILNMVDELARKDIEPHAARFDKEGTHLENGKVITPRGYLETIEKMAKKGLLGVIVPEQWGGLNLSYTLHCAIVERVTRACSNVALVLPTQASTIELIMKHGTPEAKEKYLQDLATGKRIGALALSEPNSGSDLAAVETTAKREGDTYIVNGEKDFISHGGIAGVYFTLTTLDPSKGTKGLTAFAIDGHKSGFSIMDLFDKMGQRGNPTARMQFKNCHVPVEDLLGEEGQGYGMVLRALGSSRIAVAAQAVGMADAAYRRAVAYAKSRVQFGRPLVKFQAIRFKIADMAIAIHTARSMYLYTARLKDTNKPFMTESSIIKAYATEMAQKVISDALQILGGYGYLTDHHIERLYRDARVTMIYEGTAEVQRIVIAKNEIERWNTPSIT